MRAVTNRITQWSCGRYFLYAMGEEILLDADTDEAAIAAGEQLLAELETYDASY